ncbi:MAG TPA: CoA-transferase [Alphaproteobacteria bacterium]|nr:CoA-transferase [Alphaproteobacteria bacterium]
MIDPKILPDVETLAARIPDGAKLAIFKDNGVAMEATRALIRRGARNLHIVTVPTSAFQAELLIAAGCVATIETSGVTMWELGQAPAFVRAVRTGALRILDSTCPAIYSQIQAGEKGIPFIPIRGLIGSDLLAVRDDYKVIDNPFGANGEADPIVALPAIRPDVALFHAPKADRAGNVFIGRQSELKTIAHAAHASYVTVEAIVEGSLMEDETTGGATIPAMYITGVAHAPKGAWPLPMPGYYPGDTDTLAQYCQAARSEEGLAAWLASEGLAPRAAAE